MIAWIAVAMFTLAGAVTGTSSPACEAYQLRTGPFLCGAYVCRGRLGPYPVPCRIVDLGSGDFQLEIELPPPGSAALFRVKAVDTATGAVAYGKFEEN